MLYPQHDGVSQDYPNLSAKEKLAGSVSVARVRPRTSKGITDLLLPQTSIDLKSIVPIRRFTSKCQQLYLRAKVSFVIAIKQTNHSTN